MYTVPSTYLPLIDLVYGKFAFNAHFTVKCYIFIQFVKSINCFFIVETTTCLTTSKLWRKEICFWYKKWKVYLIWLPNFDYFILFMCKRLVYKFKFVNKQTMHVLTFWIVSNLVTHKYIIKGAFLLRHELFCIIKLL